MASVLQRYCWVFLLTSTLTACGNGSTPAEGRVRSVMAITSGDCLNDASADDAIDGESEDNIVSDVRQLACEQPHKYEVYHVHRVSEGRFPGKDALEALADKVCTAQFPGFVGRAYEASDLDFHVLWPSEEGWIQDRDREIVCLLASMDGSLLVGSMRGSKR